MRTEKADMEDGAALRGDCKFSVLLIALYCCRASLPKTPLYGSLTGQVNNHPRSGWLDCTLKGWKQKTRSVGVAFFRGAGPRYLKDTGYLAY
jgi:hypothetical protein